MLYKESTPLNNFTDSNGVYEIFNLDLIKIVHLDGS
jgi:hypothetical protein